MSAEDYTQEAEPTVTHETQCPNPDELYPINDLSEPEPEQEPEMEGDFLEENGLDMHTTESECSLGDPQLESNHIDEECLMMDTAVLEDDLDISSLRKGSSAASETAKFMQKYFGQLLELPQLLLNKSQVDIDSLIKFSDKLANSSLPAPLRSEMVNIFPPETFVALKTFLQTMGLNLKSCMDSLLDPEPEGEEELARRINSSLEAYCRFLNPKFHIWQELSKQEQLEFVLDSDYISNLTCGPVLFADYYGRVFEDVLANVRETKVKDEIQTMLQDYIAQSGRKKSIKDDLAATWQMIVQFLLLFKGARSSLKKISPQFVSEKSMEHVSSMCSFFEIFTDLTNLISALSVGFKTSESMIEHIRGWSPEQLASMRKQSRGFIQSIHPRELEFYPVPKKDKIRDSKATLYLFSDKLVVKVSKDGFSSQFLRGLGYHLPDITIYDLANVHDISYETASQRIYDQYSIPPPTSPALAPMVLTVRIENARTMEVVFKTGAEISDQDKQTAQFHSFLAKLVNVHECRLYEKCTSIITPSRLDLLNELARSWLRVREQDKLPGPLLSDNPGLLGEISVEKFSMAELARASTGNRGRPKEVGRRGAGGCKAIRMFLMTDSVFVTLIGLTKGVSDYTILQGDIDKISCNWAGGGSAPYILIESKSLNRIFFLTTEVVKGAAGTSSKMMDSIRNYINCFNEIQSLRATQELKLRELQVHARDPELKPNRK